jgi:hypothetical protein
MTRIVSIERCKNCSQHLWRTHPDPELYDQKFLELKSALSTQGFTVLENNHYRFASFEVTYWGVIVFSKLSSDSDNLPDVASVVDSIVEFTEKHDQGVRLRKLAKLNSKKVEEMAIRTSALR